MDPASFLPHATLQFLRSVNGSKAAMVSEVFLKYLSFLPIEPAKSRSDRVLEKQRKEKGDYLSRNSHSFSVLYLLQQKKYKFCSLILFVLLDGDGGLYSFGLEQMYGHLSEIGPRKGEISKSNPGKTGVLSFFVENDLVFPRIISSHIYRDISILPGWLGKYITQMNLGIF